MAATLDELVDFAVTGAELAAGVSPSVSARRSASGRRAVSVLRHSGRRSGPAAANANRWTAEDLEFVRSNLGRMSLVDIGARLGRSANAIKIKQVRLGWPTASKQPHELTAHKVARLMRKCSKSIIHLIDLGILPGRVLPCGRNIHVVDVRAFKRWLINPANWIYFDHRRIRDAHLRRLVELAKCRWPDRWLSTRQAAEIIGCEHTDVNRWIHAGKIPARHWANWHVLESVARVTRIPKGKGQGHSLPWSAAGDTFLIRARAEGTPWVAVARMMKQPERRLQYHLKCLLRPRTVAIA